MSDSQITDQLLQKYCAHIKWTRWLLFWLVFISETLTHRRLSRVVTARLGRKWQRHLTGLENLPTNGNFVLTVNHYRGFLTLDVLAAVLAGANVARPDLADNYLLISGQRARIKPYPPSLPARVVRHLVDFVYRRWSHTVGRVALGNQVVSIKALREWRNRVHQQPSLVFPEGKARLLFGRIRSGTGRWLAALHTPIVPVGVWWCDDCWHVSFGPPLSWSHRSELLDMQLGLAIAALLPPELAPHWQTALVQWHEAHKITKIN